MQLSGELIKLFSIDTIILLIAFVISFYYVKKKTPKQERKYWIIYMLITFSSYNIFLKPVQDYLIPIPRTYIFYQKILGSLSIFDIFICFVFLKVLWKIARYPKEQVFLFSRNSLSVVLRRDLILLALSCLGFLFYYLADQPTDLNAQIRIIRGVLGGIAFVYFTYKLLKNYNEPHECIRLASMILVIDFINMMSQFVSSFFLTDIAWERGGHKVVLLDQTEGLLFFSYLPFILIKNRIIPKYIKSISLIVICLMIYNAYKFNLLLLGIAFVVTIVFGLFYGKTPKRLTLIGMLAMFLIAPFLINVFEGTSGSKMSRVGQINSLVSVLEKNPVNLFFGIGDGGLIPRQTMSEDGGEIRGIDLDNVNDSGFQGVIQIQYLRFIYTAGLFGFCYAMFVFIKLLARLSKLIKISWLIFFFYLCWVLNLSGMTALFWPDLQFAIFTCTQYIIFVMLYRIYTYHKVPSQTNNFNQGKKM